MKTIKGVKKYIAHCYEIDTGEKIRVYWSEKEFAFAEHLCRRGGLSMIEGLGYVYYFDKLKEVMESLTEGELQHYKSPSKTNPSKLK